MIPDAKLEPEYVYQENPPEVKELQCQEDTKIGCQDWMTPLEMFRHYQVHHPEYGATKQEDVNVFFEVERTRRYGR